MKKNKCVPFFLFRVVVALWCTLSLGCVAGEVQLPASSEPPHTKNPIQFKLMTGKQYSLCRDYVDMLNKTRYTEIPVCERKMLPEFAKFRAVEWTEITDTEEIRKMMKEQIRLDSKWLVEGQIEGESQGKVYGRSGQPDYRKSAEARIKSVDKRIETGDYPRMFRAKVDMDHDGERDNVYRFVRNYPDILRYNLCTQLNTYLVIYKDKQKTERAYSRGGGKARPGLHGGVDASRLFYYDGRAFQDYWEGINARYQLQVNEVSGRPNQVCGVNIVQ